MLKIDLKLSYPTKFAKLLYMLMCFGIFESMANTDALAKKYYTWKCYDDPILNEKFQDLADFVSNNPGWPNKRIKRNAEGCINDNDSPESIIAWFSDKDPLTANGLIYLIKSQKSKDKAIELFRKYWVKIHFNKIELQRILHIPIIRHAINRDYYYQKLNHLLYEEKYDQVKDLLHFTDHSLRELVNLRMELSKNSDVKHKGNHHVKHEHEINRKIEKNLASFKDDGGLYYQAIKWHLSQRNNDLALKMLLNSNFKEEEKEFAEKWWLLRNLLFRRLIEEKRYKDAYKIVKAHYLKEGEAFANAEWIVGWLALSFLKNPKEALDKFTKIYHKVQTPISLSTMAFWAGEAAKAMGSTKESINWYKKAVIHTTTYYGQLAESRLHSLKIKSDSKPEFIKHFNSDLKKSFDSKEVIRVLSKIAKKETQEFLLIWAIHLAETLTDPMEHALLIEFLGNHCSKPVAVWASKRGIKKNFILTSSAYPSLEKKYVKNLLNKMHNRDLIFALSHSIIRQESNFDPQVESSAKAVGLMQLIAATAHKEEKRLLHNYGIPVAKHHDLKHPEKNMMLGLSHVNYLWKEYKGCLVLMLCDYNAGDPALDEWIKIFGDPRDDGVDIVQWVECIPFGETRDYVKKVISGFYVYLRKLDVDHPFSHQDLLSIMKYRGD